MERTVAELGRLDTLINNAGVMLLGPAVDAPLDEWQRMVQINLRGWDTHQNAFRDLKGKNLPSIDRCLSGFLDEVGRA